MGKRGIALVAGFCLAMGTAVAPAKAQVDVDAFIKKDKFGSIKLSPSGEFYAASVPLEDRTAFAVMRRSDRKLTTSFALGKNVHVADFWWVSDGRVLFSVEEKYGSLDEPFATGELFAVGAEGGAPEMLVGYRVADRGPGTRIQSKTAENVSAFLVDPLTSDSRNVIVSIWPWNREPFSRAERMDIYTGRRVTLARAPVARADFTTDHQGVVRFALGSGSDNVRKLYYRAGADSDWELINDEAVSGRVETPVGFSSDNTKVYLTVEQTSGPDVIVEMNVATKARKDVFRNDNVDPAAIIVSNQFKPVPVGALFVDGKPRTEFFDGKDEMARLYRSLEAVFPGESVSVTSSTVDGRLLLVRVGSDRNPGDFYVFDTEAKKVDYLVGRRDWLDPALMAEARPIRLKARDGLELHGYVTLPQGSGDGPSAMVVLPHGGPFQVRDWWGFDSEVQMLAAAGYAVLQVNFRGSDGYGRAFAQAGARQWGGAMQDDLTDATRWAIDAGLAEPGRICIYGASYGAYASLMGAAKEPDLYRCAAGYVGVYDLPMMHTAGGIRSNRSRETYLRQWLGEKSQLSTVSPTNMAERIKVPVFLAAGGEDERAPIQHSELMERRLKAAGVPVETLYYKTEGHGFYTEEHQREYYRKLLDFFSRHIGGAKAK